MVDKISAAIESLDDHRKKHEGDSPAAPVGFKMMTQLGEGRVLELNGFLNGADIDSWDELLDRVNDAQMRQKTREDVKKYEAEAEELERKVDQLNLDLDQCRIDNAKEMAGASDSAARTQRIFDGAFDAAAAGWSEGGKRTEFTVDVAPPGTKRDLNAKKLTAAQAKLNLEELVKSHAGTVENHEKSIAIHSGRLTKVRGKIADLQKSLGAAKE